MACCDWAKTSAVNEAYHNEEWGVPLYDDQKQFEFLMLEVMQCGLSWTIVINKREILRRCFDHFDYLKVASYTNQDIARIMATEGMIRSQCKIKAIIHNARCFQKIREEFGSFSRYLWQWSDGKTILYDKHDQGYIPASNGLSDKISRDLKKRGFKFLGTVTVYSHLQACGIINDHDKHCPRYAYINAHFPTVTKSCYLEKQVQFFG
ncbi:MAG: DNA-3-methyladenine glycosylase I [Alphaproteobacteria bacterium]|nr:DNA-3-methyladenine glycosylase I [Alphaproteobacteria bacterium]